MKVQELPRPEHPRPTLVRDHWHNLNGVWAFAFDPDCSGEARGWFQEPHGDRTIVVPFVHQAPLSGIGDPAQVDCVWYWRLFQVPAEWLAGRLLLHFGAVDYEATVWVNGQQQGSHRGGFTPFTLDITEACHPGENLLAVRAFDPISPAIPSGKQSERESYGCKYTRSTGIWQTVWLEPVPGLSVRQPAIMASLKEGTVRITAPVHGDPSGARVRVTVSRGGHQIARAEADASSGSARLEIAVPGPVAWGPGSPELYDLTLEALRGSEALDRAVSYFGMRDVEVSGARILINGRPHVFRGVLDQGYWPDGIYTAPSDRELRLDIERAMLHGFDSARLHQKVFEPRTLYWADHLGYLVWAEFPDWGTDLAQPEARENVRREWLEAVRRDISHPCIVIWTPFNERASFEEDAAQREFLKEMVRLTHEADPSRPVCSASGWAHVSETDIVDVHDYDSSGDALRERYCRPPGPEGPASKHRAAMAKGEAYRGQPIIASEVGGIWWDPARAASDAGWGYGERPASEEEFLKRYRDCILSLLDCRPLSGFVYTQLTDVEQEVNGLYTYGRSAKFDPAVIREINTARAAAEE
jgi:beta-galactosidase/beta-glucuronidase